MAHVGFDQLQQQLSQKAGVKNAAGLTASIGKRKYGAAAMQKAARTGTPLGSKNRRAAISRFVAKGGQRGV